MPTDGRLEVDHVRHGAPCVCVVADLSRVVRINPPPTGNSRSGASPTKVHHASCGGFGVRHGPISVHRPPMDEHPGPPFNLAVDETVIVLHPPLPLVGKSIMMERERQQNDSLVNG